MASLAELEKKAVARQESSLPDENPSKQAFIDKKEYDREIRRLENQIKKVEMKIESLEKEISLFESKIADPSVDPESIKTNDFYASYDQLQTELTQLMSIWEQLHNDLEELKNKRN